MNEDQLLSKEEMEYLLIDYLNNKLDDNTKNLFEQNLYNYPELKLEILDLQQTLNKLSQVNYNEMFSKYTRNISVEVNNKLEQNRLHNKSKYYKYLIPVMGTLAVILIALNINFTNNVTDIKQTKNNTIINLDAKEISVLLNEVNLDNSFELTFNKSSESNIDILINSVSEENLESFLNDYIDITNEDQEKLFHSFSNEKVLKTTINELTEEEYQKLLEEIKNVKIIS